MSGVWTNPNAPNLADFTLFVENNLGLPEQVVPSDSPWIGWMLNRALAIVINVPVGSGGEYTLAVYNCAAHLLVKSYPAASNNEVFQSIRKKFDLLDPIPGVVSSSSDQGTSETLAVPDALRQLTLGDLDFYKTPWGREYLSYAQDFGGIWGLS